MEKATISNRQLLILVTGFTTGSALVLSSATIGHDRWISVLIGLAEATLIAGVFITLAQRFPGRSLSEISELVYGKVIGRVVAVAFALFLLQLGSLVLRNFADYFNVTALVQTPEYVFVVMLALVCAWAAYGGVEVMARCGEVFVPPTILVVILTFFLLLSKFKISSFLPIGADRMSAIVRSGHALSAFPFAETVAFLMIVPGVKDTKRIAPAVLGGIYLAGAVILLATVRNIGVLGATIGRVTYPSFSALRLISLGEIITRVEILVGVNFLTMGFLKIRVLIYGSTVGLTKALKLSDYRSFVAPVTLMMILLAITGFTSISESIEFAQIVWPIYAPIFQFILPLLTLIVAIVRKVE